MQQADQLAAIVVRPIDEIDGDTPARQMTLERRQGGLEILIDQRGVGDLQARQSFAHYAEVGA